MWEWSFLLDLSLESTFAYANVVFHCLIIFEIGIADGLKITILIIRKMIRQLKILFPLHYLVIFEIEIGNLKIMVLVILK